MIRESREAETRIKWAAEVSGAKILDLKSLSLERVPDSAASLTDLDELYLDDNLITSLPRWLSLMTRLTVLRIGLNKLSSLPEWLGNLTRLRVLDVSRNQLTSLPESLGRLTGLHQLSLDGNQLTALPDVLGNLVNLTSLRLENNSLATLPASIGRLKGLQSLPLYNNQLMSLPETLGNLDVLTELNLTTNPMTELPSSIGNLKKLSSLYYDKHIVRSPPQEIQVGGLKAVLAFLRARQEGAVDQWTSKMLVVGEAAVGKTSVTKALCELTYDPHEPQTHGVHVDPLALAHPEIPETTMTLNVWDFGGQLEYRATQRFYLTDRSLFLLVWSSRRGWRAGGHVEAWLQAITNAAPESPILIVATHCNTSVADLDETDLCRRFPRIRGILRVDCSDGTGIGELRGQVTRLAADLPLMGSPWPTAWVRAAETLRTEPRRYVSARWTETTLESAGVVDEEARETLIAALHDRGELLHYPHDPELRDMVVLQPTWIDSMITKVLDSQEVADRGGLLGRAHRGALWQDLADPGLDEMLTALMERFDLAYRTDAADHEDVALVVERLPAGRPAKLPEEWTAALDTPGVNQLRVTYRLSSRQAGVPSWFIAREHRFTTGVAWARGVLLRHHGAATDAWALLEDDDREQPTIRLTVRSREPHTFYSILNEGFAGILTERYPGLAVQRLIPCICAQPPAPPCPHEFDYAAALRALERGRGLQCNESLDAVDPRALLLGLRPAPLEARLDQLEEKVDKVVGSTSRIERSQLLVLDTVRDLMRHRGEQGTHCPSIFTVTKTGVFSYELRLYCEQPDGPHELPDGAGVYRLRHLPAWLRNYAPYLRILLTGLKIAMPLVGPVVTGLAGRVLPEPDAARLELSCQLLDDISDQARPDLRVLPDASQGRRSSADFAQLRAALLSIAPDWGGLRERELPENRGIVYLCYHHREALRYPAQPRPADPDSTGEQR